MLMRGIVIVAVLAVIVLTVVFIFDDTPPKYVSTPPEDKPYPVRADWLVVQPTKAAQ